MKATVVCISRTLGARGEEIGRQVAQRLGFRYVDDEIVRKAAEKEGVGVDVVADAERRQGLIERLVEGLATVPADPVEGGIMHPASLAAGLELADQLPVQGKEHYRELIREMVAETAAQGRVVIVAHAAAMALGTKDGVLRVLVTASADTRAKRLAAGGKLDEKEANKTVKSSDKERRDYFKRFYDVREELPTHYDVVINTDVLSQEQAVNVILAAAA